MADALGSTIRQLRSFLADADPDRVTTTQAAHIVEACCAIERLANAGKVLFAARAAASPTVADGGYTTAAFWLAETTKAPLGEAISTLATSKALADLPDTAAALRSGGLSLPQAKEVTKAAKKDHEAEKALLELARRRSLKELQDRARQVLAQAASKEDEAARARALHGRRSLRHYLDHEGFVRLDARLAPEAGARVISSIQAEADAVFRLARRDDHREAPEAYRADALVALVAGRPLTAAGDRAKGPRGPRHDTVVVRIDAAALARGHPQSGEISEIAGVGPVPVAAVRRLLPEAWVRVVFRDTKEVKGVCHLGRTVASHIQSALEERDPTCVWPGCPVSQGLENHHFVEDFAQCGTTSLDNLARVCARHHDMITYGGFVLEGGPGHWRFRGPPPDDAARGTPYADTG